MGRRLSELLDGQEVLRVRRVESATGELWDLGMGCSLGWRGRGVGQVGMCAVEAAALGRRECVHSWEAATHRVGGGSGEECKKALQQGKQDAGHADCHEPPEPSQFIPHYVHVGPDFLYIRFQFGLDGLYIRFQFGADGLYIRFQFGADGLYFRFDGLYIRFQFGADGLYFRFDGLYFRFDCLYVRFCRQVLVGAFDACDPFRFGCHGGLASVLRLRGNRWRGGCRYAAFSPVGQYTIEALDGELLGIGDWG